MGGEANGSDRALETLRGAMGSDRVLDGASAAREIRRRTLNPDADDALQGLVRPRTSEECRQVVAILAAHGCPALPIGGRTTFWEPSAVALGQTAVAIDTLEIREPFAVDPGERLGYCGAGISVRELDRLARRDGLCLVAYPDGDGAQSLGSVAAVACTTGLGMGRVEPVEQIVGLTVVTGDATLVKTGSAWRLGRGGAARGLPDPTGIFLGAQGRFGVVTEVVVKLWPAPWLAARAWSQPWQNAAQLAAALRRARHGLDQGGVDSVRLETICAGRACPQGSEWFVRCWAPDSPAAADERCAAVARSLGGADARCWVESDAARRGELPAYDERFSVPPGEHHDRTGREGFLGIEINVNWGAQLDAGLRSLTELFENLASVGVGHRRLGIYPGAHVVSIGIQCMLTGGEASAETVRRALADQVEPLGALGAVPYRAGRLWQPLVERWEENDPACAMVRRAALPSGLA